MYLPSSLKVLLVAVGIISLVGCSAATNRSIQASLYADKTVRCTSGNMKMVLEGSSYHKKGFIQVNGSERVETAYQDSGVESTWYWGGYSVSGEDIFNNTRYKYKAIVSATGEGVYISALTNKNTPMSCKIEK